MKKKMIGSLLAVLLLLSLAVTANAEEFSGSAGWKVVFDGSKMNSSFSTADISDAITAIQPGDQITLLVKLENDSTDATNWYMKNEVLQSLEDTQSVAGGGAYTYRLIYVGSDGGTNVLFDSDSVGGEKTSAAGAGLHEATESLGEFFYLDTLSGGTKASVQLVVALDGETQGNDYQDTLARLQMNFAAEKADPNQPTPKPGTTTNTPPVKTGDEGHLAFWTALMVCSGAVVVLLLVLAKKSRKKEGDVHE